MQFGVDNNGNRINPYPKGKAICPLCNEPLIAHCGDIYSWHWQHRSDRECDPWQEHETEWHRSWKSKFPENWQEVIMEDESGEKHIADVKTGKNTVIEFQNSSISSPTIRIREAFYKRMIWVINAESFKDNFVIRSQVTTQLRNLNKRYSIPEYIGSSFYDIDIKKIQGLISEEESKTASNIGSIKNLKNQIKEFNKKHSEIPALIEKALINWGSTNNVRSQLYYDDSKFINHLKRDYYSIAQEIFFKTKKYSLEKKEAIERLNYINGLENITIEGVPSKIISYGNINVNNLDKIKVIHNSERNSLFPKVLGIKNETEYQIYGFKKDHYIFIAELSSVVSNTKNRINQIDGIVKDLDDQLIQLRPVLANELTSLINVEINQFNEQINKLENDMYSSSEKIMNYKINEQMLLIERDEEEEKSRQIIKKDLEEKRSKIMREKKGKYNFEWKHERKTWKAAKMPIYFDIGKDYLFLKTTDGSFKKVTLSEFMNHYLVKSTLLLKI